MMNVECHISAKEFLELVGKTKVEAAEKMQMRDIDSSGLKAWEVVTLYRELTCNVIDKVTLRIVELW